MGFNHHMWAVFTNKQIGNRWINKIYSNIKKEDRPKLIPILIKDKQKNMNKARCKQ